MPAPMTAEARARVEAFQRKHRIGLSTLLFTDIVGSMKLKQQLGDHQALMLIERHHAALRELLGRFKEGQEISTEGIMSTAVSTTSQMLRPSRPT